MTRAGLDIIDALLEESAPKRNHLLSSVRGDLLCKLKRTLEAAAEFARAASLAHNALDRALKVTRPRQAANAERGDVKRIVNVAQEHFALLAAAWEEMYSE